MDLNNFKSNQNCLCSSSGSVASVTSSSSRSSNGITDKQGLRTVHLRRECGMYLEGNSGVGSKLYPNVKPNSFGFSFRGGKEFGTGLFVSAIEKDSEAQYKGLKVGDQIVRINGMSVDDATHREVLQLAQSRHQLTLTVKSVGVIPVKDKASDPVTWKFVDPSAESSRHSQTSSSNCDVDRILIEVPESSQLGCGICKGPDWRPGIFVQYTKPNSLARRCGLQPGDQILQCNRISFLQIDFRYAVTVLKNSRTLDLILKKGSGIDLFPGESSGYSSSSSIADEVVSQSASKSKRLSIVAEEGDDKGLRKPSCQCKGLRTDGGTLKSSGSVDSIFDNVSNGGSGYREKSKSIEILNADASDKRNVNFQNGDNVTRTFLNFPEMSEVQRSGTVGKVPGQTVIKIGCADGLKDSRAWDASMEKQPRNGLISAEVHRSAEECQTDRTTLGKTNSISSYSSVCSLSSAISQEIQKRNERRLKGNTTKQEKVDLMRPVNRQQRHQHDLLIAELKKKQGWEDKSNGASMRTESKETKSERSNQVNETDKVPETEVRNGIEREPKEVGNSIGSVSKVCLPESSPPVCPTPDYYSDASLTDQSSNEASHHTTVKTSILKFEEKTGGKGGNGRKASNSNGVHKTVTFGQNSTKEIVPLKNATAKHYCSSNKRHHDNMAADKKSVDRVEMQSIESMDLAEPKKVAPKPPAVYFQAPVRASEKRTTVIKITEYPTDKNRREPAKFDFINRSSTENDGFDSELASTLLRSNLKNKTDAFANYSNNINDNNNNNDDHIGNGTVIKINHDKQANNVVNGKCNGFVNPTIVPAVIPTGITESQISRAKKALKTFEKNGGNTVVLKTPKIN